MAQPTQALPSWLSYSTTVVTLPNGARETSSTLLQLPLTYYGPSIPLGTDGTWTYGGLTSPASTATQTSSPTASPTSPSAPPSTTAAPSTSNTSSSLPTLSTQPSSSATPASSLSSTSATSSSSSASASSSPSATPSSPSASATSSSPPAASSSGAASPSHSSVNRTLLAAILGPVLFFLLIAFLICLVLRRRTRNRRAQSVPGLSFMDPSPPNSNSNRSGGTRGTAGEHGQQDQESGRVLGEGSPRHSGEESDPFLRAHHSEMAEATARLVSLPPAHRSSESISSDGSGYGTVLPGTALGLGAAAAGAGALAAQSSPDRVREATSARRPTVSEEGRLVRGPNSENSSSSGSRHILPPSEVLRLDEAHVPTLRYHSPTVSSDHLSPLMPPPPLDPDRLSRRSGRSGTRSLRAQDSGNSNSATDVDADENPTVMTARRVTMRNVPGVGAEPVDDRSDDEGEQQHRSPGVARSAWGALAAGGAARLSRYSWFRNLNLPGSRPSSQVGHAASRSGSGSRSRPDSYVLIDDRDLEAGSALLGSTAARRRNGELGLNPDGSRPISGVSARSAASSGGGTVYHDAPSQPGTPQLTPLPRAAAPTVPPVPRLPPLYDDYAGTQFEPSSSHQGEQAGDVLDAPAPAPVSQFASSSFATARPSWPVNPPGLPSPAAWRHSATASSEGNTNSAEERSSNAGITIDVLEEAPPAAPENWRTLTGSLGEADRRATFGLPNYVHPASPTRSEAGSLHSMRSHLSPRSPLSGSAPSSRREQSGSSSSRPSGLSHSQNRSGSSSGRSLAHSGSISSDGRRRGPSRGPPHPDLNRVSVSAMGFPAPPGHDNTPGFRPLSPRDVGEVHETIPEEAGVRLVGPPHPDLNRASVSAMGYGSPPVQDGPAAASDVGEGTVTSGVSITGSETTHTTVTDAPSLPTVHPRVPSMGRTSLFGEWLPDAWNEARRRVGSDQDVA